MSRSASRNIMKDVTTVVDMAKKAADLSEGVDFVMHPLWKAEIRMARTNPTEELHQYRERSCGCGQIFRSWYCGCKNVEKDAELFCQGMQKCFRERMYCYACQQKKKTTRHVGAAAGLAYGQMVGAESADRYQPCKAAKRTARHSLALMQS